MKTISYDEYVKRDGISFRLIRPTEVTLPQAVRILGVPAGDAARYLRAKGVKGHTALADRVRITMPERVYVRTEVEAVADGVLEFFIAKAADEKKRHDDNLRAAKAAAAEQQRKRAALTEAYPDIEHPYVSRRTAAYLTNRDLHDPLFDDDARLDAIEDETGQRVYAQDDLKAHRRVHERTGTAKGLDLHGTLARFTLRANEARQWQAENGALCAA